MLADVATSFAIAEPPAKKIKCEVIPDALGSSDMDEDLINMRASSRATKVTPPQRSRRTAAVIAQLCTSDTLQSVKRNRKRKGAHDDTEKNFKQLGSVTNASKQNVRSEAMPMSYSFAKGVVGGCFIILVPAYANHRRKTTVRTYAKIVEDHVMCVHIVTATVSMNGTCSHVQLSNVISSFMKHAWKWPMCPSH